MTAKTITARWYTDPGHGWLAVNVFHLIQLGVFERITACSYRRGTIAYLEEDLDAGTFLQAAEAQGYSIRYQTPRHAENASSVRRMPRFDPTKPDMED